LNIAQNQYGRHSISKHSPCREQKNGKAPSQYLFPFFSSIYRPPARLSPQR
jgi:hypothetical protein